MLGKRRGFGKEPMPPHSLPLCLIGAGLLWTGWFGFNAGSALSASPLAALAFLNTSTATSTAVVAWAAIEWLHRGKPTALGGAPRRWPAWWRSPRPAATSRRSARWRSGSASRWCRTPPARS
jgi:hypothetical protein